MGRAKQPQAELQQIEVIFRDHRRKQHHMAAAAEPAPLPGIARSSCLKMLGVYCVVASLSQHITF